ncbi:MAG: flagellar hook-basal body complex protein FliE [Christensenellales bacterium]|jgi:flagellar hook-basal body complex protein FliE
MVQIENLTGIRPSMEGTRDVQKTTETAFSDVLKDAVQEALSTEAADRTDSAGLLTGLDNDIHTGMIESTKAEMALNLAIQK